MSKKITEIVERELTPFLEENGYELYHVEFLKEGKDWILRVYIEKAPKDEGDYPENVGTDDCEVVSRFLSARFDEMDPIEQNYYLEVSSPGMDRPLLKERDFKRYEGRLVDVKLYESMEGKKTLNGILAGYNENSIMIKMENGEVIQLPRDKVSKVKLTIVF